MFLSRMFVGLFGHFSLLMYPSKVVFWPSLFPIVNFILEWTLVKWIRHFENIVFMLPDKKRIIRIVDQRTSQVSDTKIWKNRADRIFPRLKYLKTFNNVYWLNYFSLFTHTHARIWMIMMCPSAHVLQIFTLDNHVSSNNAKTCSFIAITIHYFIFGSFYALV